MAPASTCWSSMTGPRSKRSACPAATNFLCACRRRPAAPCCAVLRDRLQRAFALADRSGDRRPGHSRGEGLRRARPRASCSMGQGEPFANFDEVVEALRILNDPDGMAIGARHLTVSTCGVIPGIKRFAELREQSHSRFRCIPPSSRRATSLCPAEEVHAPPSARGHPGVTWRRRGAAPRTSLR